jgi:hypothetical protein
MKAIAARSVLPCNNQGGLPSRFQRRLTLSRNLDQLEVLMFEWIRTFRPKTAAEKRRKKATCCFATKFQARAQLQRRGSLHIRRNHRHQSNTIRCIETLDNLWLVAF